jgi:hypothetical protein
MCVVKLVAANQMDALQYIQPRKLLNGVLTQECLIAASNIWISNEFNHIYNDVPQHNIKVVRVR